MQNNILFLGFGDLAGRTCSLLPDWQKTGVARSPKPCPEGVAFRQGAVTDFAVLNQLRKTRFDCVVITLAPSEPGDAGYLAGYVEPVQALVTAWQEQPPGLILFVSSTSVYGQQAGEWVTESSATDPDSFAGQRLLQAESLLRGTGLNVSLLRFAGIYGPGRDYLLRQVRAGKGGDDSFTNRIHIDDGAAAIVHLVLQHASGRALAPCYLVCDSNPAPACEVRRWLAGEIGVDPDALESGAPGRGGNKRCSNRRLLETGFALRYPDYRSGYRAPLRPDHRVG